MARAAFIALGAAALAQPAFAQDDEATVLPEVVITAERRVQNLQEVPIAATVISGEQLAERGVANIADIQRVAPSVAINTYNRSTFINIRGIGIAQSAPTSTPGVAYYLNGGLIPHEQTIGMSFYDLESIQVLRGPQGTLTGQNSTGGAVYITTPKPVIGESFGYIDQTLTDYAGSRTIGALNVPISDSLALRVAGVIDRRDSFTTNIGGPSEPGNLNVGAIRADLLFKPTERLATNLRFEKFRNDNDYNAIKNRNDAVTSNPFVIEEDAISRNLQDGYRAEIETRYDLTDGVQLRVDLNYQYGFNEDRADGDRTATAAPPTGRIGYARTVFNTRIAEVDLISTGEGPLQWVAGAFYLNEKVPLSLVTYRQNTVKITAPPTSPPSSITQTEAENTSQSIFGQVNYRFEGPWEVLIGARYSEDEQIYERIRPVSPTGVANSDNITGRVAVNYHLSDATMFYGSVARGYKAGGVNLVAGDAPFEPEQNLVTELGVKTTLLAGRLRVNATVFDSKYENLQLSGLSGGLPSTKNVPESISHGGELEVTGIFGNLEINGGVAYLKAETDSDALLTNNTGIGPSPQIVTAGAGLPFSPEWTANAGLQYTWDLARGRITPRLQVSHMSEQYASIFRNVNTLVPERTIWDARLTYDSGGAWRAEAFVSNLTDEVYIASQVQNSSSSNGGIMYGAPRVYGARLLINFD